MNKASITELDTLFKALADETRLRILGLLAAGEVCVCDIHGALGVPQPTASRHLAYLRRSGLVAARREGQWMHYSITMPVDPALESVLRSTLEALGTARPIGSDRRRLSALTAIPLVEIERAAADCCKKD